jgi:uncharacterized membrane protein
VVLLPYLPKLARSWWALGLPAHEFNAFVRSREYDEVRGRVRVGLVLATFAAAVVVISSLQFDGHDGSKEATYAAGGFAVAVLAGVTLLRNDARRGWQDRMDAEEQARVRAEAESVVVAARQPDPPLLWLRRKLTGGGHATELAEDLHARIQANGLVLESYQDPVRRRARSSYTYAQGALAVGFLALVGGAVAVLVFADTPQSQVAVGALTAVGSALSGYIAATYLRIYDRAQQQLNFYFEAPLIASYMLEAERLAPKGKSPRRCVHANPRGGHA